MNKFTVNVCPVCEGKEFGHVSACTDFFVSGDPYELCSCQRCGFVFTQDFPVAAEIGRYYASAEYVSHSDTRKGLINFLYHQVRKYMLVQKARLVCRTSHLRHGRLLDVGTGTGYFPATMISRGWKVEAIEKDPDARRFAFQAFGMKVREEEALWQWDPGSFDVITLWHVLEHIEPLNAWMSRLAELLADEGVLIIAVPNRSSYDAERYGTYWAAYDVPRHLWHFTPATIQALGARHGLTLAARYPMPFDAFYVSMLSEKYKGSRFPLWKGVLTGLAAWRSTWSRKDRSSSLIYIFRKKQG
ncbi:MAG: class I SAM-dependent methyltransferase [Bacteroides sp.]|nr:class I SAM-dependent methyltransferase [Bacteroides sp.]